MLVKGDTMVLVEHVIPFTKRIVRRAGRYEGEDERFIYIYSTVSGVFAIPWRHVFRLTISQDELERMDDEQR